MALLGTILGPSADLAYASSLHLQLSQIHHTTFFVPINTHICGCLKTYVHTCLHTYTHTHHAYIHAYIHATKEWKMHATLSSWVGALESWCLVCDTNICICVHVYAYIHTQWPLRAAEVPWQNSMVPCAAGWGICVYVYVCVHTQWPLRAAEVPWTNYMVPLTRKID